MNGQVDQVNAILEAHSFALKHDQLGLPTIREADYEQTTVMVKKRTAPNKTNHHKESSFISIASHTQ